VRIIYNQEKLFKAVNDEDKAHYAAKVHEFAKALEDEPNLKNKALIDRFKIKKIKGTNDIFKFYLSARTGARCTFKHETFDDTIFYSEPGIMLLEISTHDAQGDVGRKLDKAVLDKDEYTVYHTETIPEAHPYAMINTQFMKDIHIKDYTDEETFVQMMLSDDNKVLYKLSNQQMKAVVQEGATFLLGCAGSGKTLVEIAKALKNVHEPINQAYFTFTNMLKDSAKELYQKYHTVKGIKGKTDFFTVHAYMLEMLGLKETDYFSFSRYLEWFESEEIASRYPVAKAVGPIDLWIEIRGLLKGYIGNAYFRIETIYNITNYLSSDEINFLKRDKVIAKKAKSNSLFIIKDDKKLAEFVEAYPNFKASLMQKDLDSPLIDERTYVHNIGRNYSQFNNETKQEIYRFVKEVYQPFLDKHRLNDDNDLARKILDKIYKNELNRFDYVLVDELQDLTEMQIYTLSRLAKSPHNVYMSGDVSQVINPTFFRIGRIGMIFKNMFKVTMNRNLTLNENYRNSTTIVNITKDLLTIKKEKLGEDSDDVYEESKQVEKTDGLPFHVDISKDEFLEIMRVWIGLPKVAIIVSNEKTKQTLYDYYNLTETTNIYTVQEVKGQEFEKVILYDIISEHNYAWEEILSGSVDKKGELVTKYRYYFNLLYVAITRARNNLFMFESNKQTLIYQELKHHFEQLTDDVLAVMDLKAYDNYEETLNQANKHFKQEDYDRARSFYLRIEDREMALISEGFSFIKRGKYHEGLKILYAHSKYHSKLYTYTTSDKKNLPFKLLIGHKLHQISDTEIIEHFNKKRMSEMLKPLKNDPIYKQLIVDLMVLYTEVNGRLLINQSKGKEDENYAR